MELINLFEYLLIYKSYVALRTFVGFNPFTHECAQYPYQKTNLQLLEPDLNMLKTAMTITDSGHTKSGYPSFYDAIYHAMALCFDCLFITADKRYYEKTKKLEKIALLENWEQVV